MSPAVRKSSRERRREISLAVLRIIGERGMTSLTTATLAAEVGLTTGALFRHFASREEMLDETTLYAIALLEKTFPHEALPPLERIVELARNRIRLLSRNAGLSWLLRSDQAYLTLPEASVKRLRKLVERSRRYLLKAIREGMDDGSIRDDIEADLLLIPVMGTIHALIGMSGVHQVAMRGRKEKAEKVLSVLARLLEPPDHVSKRGGRSRQTRKQIQTHKERPDDP
ncbi:MAG: TetR/AcrR family transcriptional regulator [Acidobacteriota bacterium]